MSKKFIFVNVDGDYEETPGAYEVTDFIDATTGVADAGKPIVLDASGHLDPSFIVASGIDHGSLSGLGDDDHQQYILVDGSRAFTGNIDAGGNLGVNFLDPVNAQDAATKAYVDLMGSGLRPHPVCRVATVSGINLAAPGSVIDGVALNTGDRVVVWQQANNVENGIYVFNGASSAMTRATDFDTNGEVFRGSWVPETKEGDEYAGSSFVQLSEGSNTDGSINFGVDAVTFDVLTSPLSYTGDKGIILDHVNKTVSVDILDTDSGLSFLGAASDELAIDWASVFVIDGADDKAFKASDLASTTVGKGASTVGVADTNGYFTSNNVEGVLAELYSQATTPTDSNTFTAGANISKGDLVYMSGNDEVSTHPGTSAVYAIGIAKTDALAGASVEVLKDDTILTGLFTSATPGDKYYWDGTSWVTSLPPFSGFYVWRVGTAKNATDAYVDVEFVKRNS